MMNHAAVLTGDIIASTLAGPVATDGAIAMLHTIAQTEQAMCGADVRFARFRGDGWQMYCSDPTRVFRLTARVLASMHSRPDLPQTRVAAAIGQVAALPSQDISSASGEAFAISGQLLDGMTTQRLLFQNGGSSPVWQIALFSYLDWQSSRWSPEQAEAVSIAFSHDPARPASIGKELGISRQAAQSRLKGAGFWPLLEAAAAFGVIAVGS